jgi:MFS family permease
VSLAAPDLRRVVVVLSLSQVVSWGCLYYGFAALQSSITRDTGWSATSVTAAFSLSQLASGVVGVWVGGHLDARGPRAVMTGASLLAGPGMLVVAAAPSLPWFFLGWLLVGTAMAGTLYPPAFAAVTRWGGESRVRALTTVTLAGGLASTVFAPLAAGLDAWAGWRAAYVGLAAVVLVVTVPLHWRGLDHPWPVADQGQGGDAAGAEEVVRSRAFLLLGAANALAALAAFAVVVNLVPMLREQGLDTRTAAIVLGLGGLGQVLGRIGYPRLAASIGVTARGVSVVGAMAVLTAALALAPVETSLVVAISLVLGLARGLHTLVQATAVTDRWGPASYGRLNGVLTAPALAASAAAPFAGALLASVTGSYATAFLVLAGVAAAAALLLTGATPADPGSAGGGALAQDIDDCQH